MEVVEGVRRVCHEVAMGWVSTSNRRWEMVLLEGRKAGPRSPGKFTRSAVTLQKFLRIFLSRCSFNYCQYFSMKSEGDVDDCKEKEAGARDAVALGFNRPRGLF